MKRPRPSRHRLFFVLGAFVAIVVGPLATGCTGNTTTRADPARPSSTVGGAGTSGTTGERATTSRTGSTARSPGGTAAPTGDPAPVCELITEADAREVFGEAPIAGVQGIDECWWSTPNDLKTVNIKRDEGDIDTWRAGYQNGSWERIDLGDEGYAGNVFDSIVFRIGGTTYEINVIYSTKGEPDRVVRQLADKVVARLE